MCVPAACANMCVPGLHASWLAGLLVRQSCVCLPFCLPVFPPQSSCLLIFLLFVGKGTRETTYLSAITCMHTCALGFCSMLPMARTLAEARRSCTGLQCHEWVVRYCTKIYPTLSSTEVAVSQLPFMRSTIDCLLCKLICLYV